MKFALLFGAGILWVVSPLLALVCFVAVTVALWGRPLWSWGTRTDPERRHEESGTR